ncbi:MAG: C1 family peptidase [Candidatus Nitrotoga sp.]
MKAEPKKPIKRILNARRDTLDFRDQMYIPTLIEVPTHVPVEEFISYKVPVLDQGTEGACTGFGLATVANYLLRRRKIVPNTVDVSPRMLYELARRYDEWPGEDYSGSSARGAMKGWNKHGVCAESDWPYELSSKHKRGLTDERTSAAKYRPLGAYFRVNHQDLIAMHAAISEVGALFATATVHDGWNNVKQNGIIVQSANILGGHAFAIVAYDSEGFWIQNSWSTRWGNGGLARISYDDWLDNGTDVWVARLGAPVNLMRSMSIAVAHASVSGQSNAYSYADLRPHLISIGNNGKLKAGGDYGSTPAEVAQIFEDDFPRLMKGVKKKRLLLYAHGGLVSEKAAVQRVAEYRPALLEAGVYPIAFIWNSDYWTTLTNILQDSVRRRRPEGILDATKDFMLDRLDDALEPLARVLTGKASWGEMKENALASSQSDGGVRLVLDNIVKLMKSEPDLEIHIVGHSAGSILHAPLIQLMTGKGKLTSGPMKGEKGYNMTIASCTLWAPACTVDLFKEAYLPAIKSTQLEKFALFALSDKAEQDDNCARIYNKSLLYLVSNAFEDKQRIPLFREGVPILGMEHFIQQDKDLKSLFDTKKADLVISPNSEPMGSIGASKASHHGDFDDDQNTVMATFARISPATLPKIKSATTKPELIQEQINFQASKSSLREKRMNIDAQTIKIQ